jgi:ATP-binding cassette subfamily F protein 3
VLFVSHDRALIDAVATHTASIENQLIVLRHGDYNDYLEALAERPPPPPPPANAKAKDRPKQRPAAPAKRRPSQRTQRLIRELETSIARLEAEQAELEAALAEPAAAGDHARLGELGTRHQQVQEELAWNLLEWERVQVSDGVEV